MILDILQIIMGFLGALVLILGGFYVGYIFGRNKLDKISILK